MAIIAIIAVILTTVARCDVYLYFVINPALPADSVEIAPEYQEVEGEFAKVKPTERTPDVPPTFVLVGVYQHITDKQIRFLGWAYLDADFVNELHQVPQYEEVAQQTAEQTSSPQPSFAETTGWLTDRTRVAWPSRLTLSVAGMSAEEYLNSNSSCWHDPKSGYYVCKNIDCDAEVTVRLTKDRRMVNNSGNIERPLELSTKHGIRIGMSPDEVLRTLGQPNRTAIRGSNKEYWCALYMKIDTKAEQALNNTYIFKHGKLIEIEITLTAEIYGEAGLGVGEKYYLQKWPSSEF
jgi:hypothetical protein